MRCSFVVFSKAAPQGSKRFMGQGVMIESSTRVKPFRQDVRYTALDSIPDDWPIDAAMRVHYRFHFKRPPSHLTTKGNLTKSAPKQPTGRNVGDIEKLARAVSDALSGVAFTDDSQVIEMRLEKAFDDRDLVVITLEPVYHQQEPNHS
jgi:crossover junction endodeoxyribonuclease RusA